MNDKKHIDRLFQERFKDFEATPSDAVWKNIEAALNQQKKKRRMIPVWWQYAGVAAALLLFLTIGGFYMNQTQYNAPNKTVTIEDEQTRSSNSENTTKIAVENNAPVYENDVDYLHNKIPSNTSKESVIAVTPSVASEKENHSKANKKPKTTSKLSEVKYDAAVVYSEEKNKENKLNNPSNNSDVTSKNNKSLINSEHAKELINNSSKENNAIAKVEEKDKNNISIEEALDSQKDKIEKEKHLNRWRIAPNAAPVYFNSLGEGSSIDPQFNSNSKTGEVNMSYGVSASYAVNNKLKVRSGINKVNLGYNTNNVVVYQSLGVSSSKRALQNLDVRPSNSATTSIISGESIGNKSELLATTSTSINQALGYIEVPLEIQYALVNNKLGINLIGGFSSFFLSDNKIYSEAESGGKTFLGKANNINNVSYSANVGVGFNYQVSKKIDLNIEPMFKYQMNTFNNTSGDFTPYFIGVYTGFAIKF